MLPLSRQQIVILMALLDMSLLVLLIPPYTVHLHHLSLHAYFTMLPLSLETSRRPILMALLYNLCIFSIY